MAPATTTLAPPRRIALVRWRSVLLSGAICVSGAGWLRGAPAGTAASSPPPSASGACLECHSDRTLTMKKAGHLVSLFVDPAALPKSAHGSLDCTDCHEGFDAESIPHKRPLKPVDCASCHDEVARKHVFHPRLTHAPIPAGADTSCVSLPRHACHCRRPDA